MNALRASIRPCISAFKKLYKACIHLRSLIVLTFKFFVQFITYHSNHMYIVDTVGLLVCVYWHGNGLYTGDDPDVVTMIIVMSLH